MSRALLLAGASWVGLVVLAGCGSAPAAPRLEQRDGFEPPASPVVALAVTREGRVAWRSGDGTFGLQGWPAPAAAPGGPRRLAVPNDQLLALSPDGSELVVSVTDPPAPREKVTDPRRGALQFVAAASAKQGELWTFEERWGCPVALAWRPDGRELAVAFSDAHVRVFARDKSQLADLATYRNRSKPEDPLPVGVFIETDARVVRALAYSPDGDELAAAVFLPDAGTRCHLLLWRRSATGGFGYAPGKLAAKRLGDLVEGEAPVVASLAFAPDGKTIACAGHIVTGRQKTVPGVVDPFGLKSAELFGRAWIVSAENGAILDTIDGELDAPIASVAFFSAEELVLGAFRSLRVWSLARRETAFRLEAPASLESAYAKDRVLRFDAEEIFMPVVAVSRGAEPSIYASLGRTIVVVGRVTPPR